MDGESAIMGVRKGQFPGEEDSIFLPESVAGILPRELTAIYHISFLEVTIMTTNQYTGNYNMDMTWCMDLTGSMYPYLDNVKIHARLLADKIREKMQDVGKSVDTLRIRIVGFRDYKYDGSGAMVTSRFFCIPDENEALQQFLDGLEATGGGDDPENSLEALALAMGSEWDLESELRRHVIVLFTDTDAVELHDPSRTKNKLYPSDMPADLAELCACWCGTNQTKYTMPDTRAGRLLIFAPKMEPWVSMGSLPWVWHTPSVAGEGLKECDLESVLDIIVNSVSI